MEGQKRGRGYGTCVCGESYLCRRKPEQCEKCKRFLGGKAVSVKKHKKETPDCVAISDVLYSVKTSSRDDRCFVVKERDSFICLHGKECKALRSTYLTSGKTSEFKCRHSEKTKDSVCPMEEMTVTEESLKDYTATDEAKKKIRECIMHLPEGHSPVVRVSDTNFAVFGLPNASNTVGYCHVKVVSEENNEYTCSSKTCRSFMSKAKQAKSRIICSHLHLLFCCLKKGCDQLPATAAAASDKLCEESSSRRNTIYLASYRSLPYHFPKSVISAIFERDSATFSGSSGWPTEFYPLVSSCLLCQSPLSSDRPHPGQNSGDYALLITYLNPFKKVKVSVRVCTNADCKAMHSPDPIDIGLFNVSDKVLVSIDIFLEFREMFKTGNPISLIIQAKLESLKLHVSEDVIPTHGQLLYISELLYNGYFCFEAITQRDLDSVICGICGVCPEVLLGDGNEKNCCSNSQINYKRDELSKPELPSAYEFYAKLKRRWIEKCIYTRTLGKLELTPAELPPLISPKLMASRLLNTEMKKDSIYLKAKEQPLGDPSMLHELISRGDFSVESLQEESLEGLKDICKYCGIPSAGKSKAFLLNEINGLYSSVLVGLCPCHGYSKLPGRTGGFYHLVCRHGCTYASKFLTLTESVRDAADLYLSLKYPPITFISDSPCGFARHLEFRDASVAKILWGENRGCFEKPCPDKEPRKNLSFPEITPMEYRETEVEFKDNSSLAQYEHPITGTTRRFVLGDRFHSASNPHKSPLCNYHDINLCKQANSICTSMQESENNRKNNKRLRSTCQQSFEVHYMYNFLMDFYLNESIVKEQKRALESELQESEFVVRNNYHRFVISEK